MLKIEDGKLLACYHCLEAEEHGLVRCMCYLRDSDRAELLLSDADAAAHCKSLRTSRNKLSNLALWVP